MSALTSSYKAIIERTKEWIDNEPGIRGLAIIGSQARTSHPADEWSDLDFIILATDTERYLHDLSWIELIGTHLLTFVASTADHRNRERRILFDGGQDVDFSFFPVEMLDQMIANGIPLDIANELNRGAKILIDKDGLLERFHQVSKNMFRSTYGLPSEEEFSNLVTDFWYHAVHAAKHLRRGELWWSKQTVDHHLKNLLRTMLEWNTQAASQDETDTWLHGRHLEEWANPQYVTALADVYAHFHTNDIWRALFATMKLFRTIEYETEKLMQISRNHHGEDAAEALVYNFFQPVEEEWMDRR